MMSIIGRTRFALQASARRGGAKMGGGGLGSLVDLYNKKSKHSSYQRLAPAFRALEGDAGFELGSKYEDERFEAIRASSGRSPTSTSRSRPR